MSRATAAMGPHQKAREGSAALAPGISVRWTETPRWEGWEVRASRQEGRRQRLRTWTLRANALDAALLEAARWRCSWSGDPPEEVYERLLLAISPTLRRRIAKWRRGIGVGP